MCDSKVDFIQDFSSVKIDILDLRKVIIGSNLFTYQNFCTLKLKMVRLNNSLHPFEVLHLPIICDGFSFKFNNFNFNISNIFLNKKNIMNYCVTIKTFKLFIQNLLYILYS